MKFKETAQIEIMSESVIFCHMLDLHLNSENSNILRIFHACDVINWVIIEGIQNELVKLISYYMNSA